MITTIVPEQTDLSELKDNQCAFLRDILSENSVDLLLAQMANSSNDVTTVGFTIKLFVSMITAKPMALSLAGANEEFSSNSLHVLNQTITLAFQNLNSVFEPLITVFNCPPFQKPLLLSHADSAQTPFGWVRLEIVEFVTAILDQFASNFSLFVSSSHETLDKLLQSNIIGSIIDAFFAYIFNNILHGLTLRFLKSYLSICGTLKSTTLEISDKISWLDLEKKLFSDTAILRLLNESWEYELNRRSCKTGSLDSSKAQPFSVSKGNFGHVISLTDEINKYLNESRSDEEHLPSDFEKHWRGPITDELNKVTNSPNSFFIFERL